MSKSNSPKMSYPKGNNGTFAFNTNSASRGYGSKAQTDRATRKNAWANKNQDKLLTPDELVAENKRREQEALKARLGR